MRNLATAAPASQRSDDTQHRRARLDRVVEHLRALERSRDSTGSRGGEFAKAVRAWEREASATRRRLTVSPRVPPIPTRRSVPTAQTMIRWQPFADLAELRTCTPNPAQRSRQ